MQRQPGLLWIWFSLSDALLVLETSVLVVLSGVLHQASTHNVSHEPTALRYLLICIFSTLGWLPPAGRMLGGRRMAQTPRRWIRYSLTSYVVQLVWIGLVMSLLVFGLRASGTRRLSTDVLFLQVRDLQRSLVLLPEVLFRQHHTLTDVPCITQLAMLVTSAVIFLHTIVVVGAHMIYSDDLRLGFCNSPVWRVPTSGSMRNIVVG